MGKANKKDPKWIPCGERVPENGRCVLITIEPYGIVVPGWHVGVSNTWYRLYQGHWEEVTEAECSVTAWQDFPEPYNSESEG